ncbi:unnamed protein product [Chironomus riparius]|uniref:Potassium channel domain-containing protein n=1 Tax=Chironomus riparius TaxID=315576 RepID=A0A9N9RNC4_9DIPT|nr:unnamed protein product [Chironomus riparius]
MINRDEDNTIYKQRPRVTLQIPSRAYELDPHQPSPFIPLTGVSSIPNVEGNPFLQALYAQRAGDFMSKQFEGLNRFRKSGLSVGEKSVVWLYTKFGKFSKKWFTHIFLFLVVTLYSVAGAFLFMAIEGPPETQFFEDVRKGRMKLSSTARNLSSNVELLQDDLRWEGEFTRELYEYELILYKAFEKGQYDNAELKKTWTFFNAIFYCGTIYTTIGE